MSAGGWQELSIVPATEVKRVSLLVSGRVGKMMQIRRRAGSENEERNGLLWPSALV